MLHLPVIQALEMKNLSEDKAVTTIIQCWTWLNTQRVQPWWSTIKYSTEWIWKDQTIHHRKHIVGGGVLNHVIVTAGTFRTSSTWLISLCLAISLLDINLHLAFICRSHFSNTRTCWNHVSGTLMWVQLDGHVIHNTLFGSHVQFLHVQVGFLHLRNVFSLPQVYQHTCKYLKVLIEKWTVQNLLIQKAQAYGSPLFKKQKQTSTASFYLGTI